jgi:hypothetical protein
MTNPLERSPDALSEFRQKFPPAAVAKAIQKAHDSEMDEIRTMLGRLEPMITRIDERMKDMPTGKDFGELKAKVAALPTAEKFGELIGKVGQIPNWWQLFLFVFMAVGGAALLGKTF